MGDTSKRPWWMLHWPTWLAAVLFTAVFLVANLVGVGDKESGVWVHGWPKRWSTRVGWVDVRPDPEDRPLWGGYAVPRQVEVMPRYWTFADHKQLNRSALLVDVVVAILIVIAATVPVEKRARRLKAKVSLESFFFFTAMVGATCLVLPLSNLDLTLRDLRTVAIFLIPVAIGLSCLTLLDIAGLLYNRLTRDASNE